MKIDVTNYRHIVVLTGAGISVASGLRPYRGPGGIWTDGGDETLATAAGFSENPEATWQLFGPLRNAAREAEPNAAHIVLADLESRCPGALTIVTQNVDGLHTRAGSTNVIEIHGNIFGSRCAAACGLDRFEERHYAAGVPACPACGAALRPDVVFFGEALPADKEWSIKQALREVDLFIAVGTSGTVSPASNYVRSAAYNKARTVYVNLQAMEPSNPYFQETVLGPAESVLPELFEVTR